MISMEDWITIRNLKKRNPKMGTRSIAKQLNLSRNAVRNALRSEDPPEYKRKAYINQELEPFQEYITEQYFVKKLKGSRVLNDLHSKGCKVSSSAYYEIVGKAYFSNISALLYKLDRAQHSDFILTIFLEVSI